MTLSPSPSRTAAQPAPEIRGDRLRLVGVGQLKVRWHRPIPDHPVARTAIVPRSCGRWYVSITLEIPAIAPPEHTGDQVGLDLGIASFATL